jgi:hypothetical protein
VPAVKNGTNGALTDAQAQAMVAAFWKANAIYQWGANKDELALVVHLNSENLFVGPELEALGNGVPVQDPNCDVYPSAVTVLPMSPPFTSWLAQNNQSVKATYALFITVGAPGGCTVTQTVNGKTTPLLPSFTTAKLLVPGSVLHDPALGDVFYSEAQAACTQRGAPASLCG